MRLLLIEDEFRLCEALCETFVREGYTVDSAHNGKEGLVLAQTGLYDAILLDVMLPLLDGFSVLRQLRAEGFTTPVLMLTAKGELDDRVRGLDYGADDYLCKPFETKELLARLRAATRQRGRIEDLLAFGDIVLSLKKREISGPAGSVRLGAKEFRFLELLLRNKKQIMTKDLLTEKIWGLNSEAEYNSTEVYATFVRRKLRFVGSRVRLKAHRGMGYILEEEND